jgi:hypothetical protein
MGVLCIDRTGSDAGEPETAIRGNLNWAQSGERSARAKMPLRASGYL